jgi:mannose-6-phosphate isomerase
LYSVVERPIPSGRLGTAAIRAPVDSDENRDRSPNWRRLSPNQQRARGNGEEVVVRGRDEMDNAPAQMAGLERWASEVQRVEKPWGYELIWALTHAYCGKVLFVKAGHSLSLQFHRLKDEAWLVQSGSAKLELGDVRNDKLQEQIVGAGAAFRYVPGTVHRVTAIEDTTILEVSTPHLDDVVRIEDAYGREGTSAP